MICRLCGVEKTDEHFRKYRHKKGTDKIYQRNECSLCLNKLSSERRRNRKINPPGVLKSQPEVLEKPIEIVELRICKDCGIEKPITDYHRLQQNDRVWYYRNCKKCYLIAINKGKEEKNPLGLRYRINPNEYTNEYQKEQTFELMNVMGWVFDEPTGVWNKPGLKENGVFLNVIPDKIVIRKRTYHGNTPVKSNYLMENIEQILKYREENVTFDELETIYNCSHTTIRKAIYEYNFKKKDL
jgi:uncharacterized protein (DUF433 family)